MKPIIPVLLLIINFYVARGQQTFYVDPATNTSGLEAVRDQVRAVNGNMTGDITVILRNGTHYLDRTFELTDADGGSNGYKVIWKGETQGQVKLSGGTEVTGWVLHDAASNIWRASVGNQEFRQIYVNNAMAIRARTPNAEETEYYGPYNEGGLRVRLSSKKVEVPVAELDNWNRLNQVELVMHPHWYHIRLRIASFDSQGQITPMEPERSAAFNKNSSFYNQNRHTFYYYENAYEFLDASGEWYLNTDNDSLYYKPRPEENMSTTSIVIPGAAETLINVEGTSSSLVQDIELSDLHFEHTNWLHPSANGLSHTQGNQLVAAMRTDPDNFVPEPAVRFSYAQNVAVTNNIFSNLGGIGLKFSKGVKNGDIIGNVLYDISGNGIVLDIEGAINPPAVDQVSDVLIANNFITRVGRNYSNAQGILTGFVKNVTIEHNELTDFHYSGMQVGQQPHGNIDTGMANNIIQYNEVHDVVQLHDDGGGIYTLARQPGTRIFENYVHNVTRGPWAANYIHVAIYNDNYSEFITVERNVLLNNSGLIFEHTNLGAQNNTYIDNNITDQAVIDNAGLQTAYENIKNLVPPEQTISDGTPTTPSFSGPTVEVEAMLISDAEVELNTVYQNGEGVKPLVVGDNIGEAEFIFSGNSGDYDLTLGYVREDDGQPEYKIFVNNVEVDSWTATQTSGGIQLAVHTTDNVNLNQGDLVKLSAQVDAGAHGRMDYLGIAPVAPPPPSSIRVEAEAMTLSGATIESRSEYSNGQGAKPSAPGGNVGEASFLFAGTSGDYDVTVAYLNENDGAPQYQLIIDGSVIDTWTGTQISSGVALDTRTINNVTINNGDEVKITGRVTAGAHGRMDYIDLIPVSQPPPPPASFVGPLVQAEDMDLTDATEETDAIYQNGEGVRPDIIGDNIGEAEFIFSGSSDSYDITIAYILETSGQPQYKLFVNNVEVDQWTGTQVSGSPQLTTHTASNITVTQNDVIKLSAEIDGTARGRLDYLELVPYTPPPPPTTTRYEAETMTLSGATVESRSEYSNGQGAKPSAPGGNIGEASFTFSGTSGNYDVTVAYLRENDGRAYHKLYINSTEISNWRATQTSSGLQVATHRDNNVSINNGDEIKITGEVSGGSHGRMDYIELTTSGGNPGSRLASSPELGADQQESLYIEPIVYPNPASGGDEVSFIVPLEEAGQVTIWLYGINGTVVKTIHKSFMSRGNQKIELNTTEQALKGVYLYRIQTSDIVRNGKLILK